MQLVTFDVEVTANQAAGALVTFDVDVQFVEHSPASSLVGFDVEVQAKSAAHSLVGFNVSVVNKAAAAKRWEAVVLLGGVDVSSRVAGSVSVGGQAGQNRTATFDLKNPLGPVDPDEFINQTVTIDYFQPDGTVNRIFTGWVETPKYIFSTGRTNITASTLKDKRLDKMTTTEIANLVGGRWSKYIMTEDAEGSDYADDRLRTIAGDLSVDANGAFRMVPWAIGSVDYTLTGSDLAETGLGVTLQDAKSLTNSIAVDVEYRYTRLRHRERDYYWEGPGASSFGDWLNKQYTFASKALIRSAIDSSGWVLKGTVTYQDVPNGGWYTVYGQKVGYHNERRGLDALSASWTLATRFTQTITEKYSLTFTAPQSVEVWGEIPSTDKSHSVTAEFTDDEWDDMEVYTGPDEGAVQTPNGDWIIDATDVAEGSRTEFESMQQIVLDMYQRELLNAHRQNYIDLTTPKKLWAEIDVVHTVQLSSDRLNATARVYSVNHTFNRTTGVRSTTLRLAVSRAPAEGSYTATPLEVPEKPNSTDQAVNVSTIKLGVHLGNSYNSPVADETWTGYITNYVNYDYVGSLEQYPTAFIVDTPAVDDSDRDEREVERVQNFDVLIPNDPLEIINV